MVNMNEDFGAYKDSIWKGLYSKRVRCDGRFCCLLWYYHYLVVFYTWMNLYISFLMELLLLQLSFSVRYGSHVAGFLQ